MNQTSSYFQPKGLITDIDGTLTDKGRRLNLDAVRDIRTLVDNKIPVILSSGNTVCAMTILCKMIGTDGTIISENGGVYRIGYGGKLNFCGDREVREIALSRVRKYYEENNLALNLYSPEYRFVDFAFERNVEASVILDLLSDLPVDVLDSEFAIHIQGRGNNKGTTFVKVAEKIGISARDFIAVGDAMTDLEMLKSAGVGVSVGDPQSSFSKAVGNVSKARYGDGFSETVHKYFENLF